MKRLQALILALCLVLALASCSSGSAAPAASGGENAAGSAGGEGEATELVYWFSWTDKIQENNLNLTRMFNESVGAERNIRVSAEYQGSYEDLHQKLQAAYVAGDTPAVTVMEIASIRTFAENGVLEPLSPYIERDGVDMDDFFEGLLINCNVDGTWFGLPYLRSTPILYMNTTLLEQAGLDTAGPANWEELADYCRQIKEKTGAYGLSMYSYIWTFEAFLLQNGSSVLNADETATNINTGAGRDVLTFFQELRQEDVIRTVAGADSSRIETDYMNQNAAMWFASTADLTKIMAIAEENGFGVNTCFIPMREQYGVPTGGCNLIMSTAISQEEKEAAWQFIKWMTEPEQAAYAHAYTGYVPSRRAAAETEQIQQLYAQTPQFKVALDQLELYGHGRPMKPAYAEVSNEIVAVMDAVWVNGDSVDTVLPAAEEKINRLLGE